MSRSGSKVVRDFVLAGALFFGGENIGNAQDIQRIDGSSSPDKAVELVSLKTVQDPVVPARPVATGVRRESVERQETVVALGEVLSIGKIENMISRGELILPLNAVIPVFGTDQRIYESSRDWQRSVLEALEAPKEDPASKLRLLDFCRRYILAAKIQIAARGDITVIIRNIDGTTRMMSLGSFVDILTSSLAADLASPPLPDAKGVGVAEFTEDTSVRSNTLRIAELFLELYRVELPGQNDPKQ